MIARIDVRTGAETEWFSAFSVDVEQVQVTRTRNHARRFKLEADALSAKSKIENVAPDHKWKVVAA